MLFRLFITFFKIGLFSFGGGFAMIPLIQREVIEKNKWINDKDFLDMLVLAQSTPGPIAVNTSVFVGYKVRGVAGAIAIGGPGAVFWMWISALLGMCTKFAEVTLAVHYRETNAHGDLVGGPMYYIKNGLKKTGTGWRMPLRFLVF